MRSRLESPLLQVLVRGALVVRVFTDADSPAGGAAEDLLGQPVETAPPRSPPR